MVQCLVYIITIPIRCTIYGRNYHLRNRPLAHEDSPTPYPHSPDPSAKLLCQFEVFHGKWLKCVLTVLALGSVSQWDWLLFPRLWLMRGAGGKHCGDDHFYRNLGLNPAGLGPCKMHSEVSLEDVSIFPSPIPVWWLQRQLISMHLQVALKFQLCETGCTYTDLVIVTGCGSKSFSQDYLNWLTRGV